MSPLPVQTRAMTKPMQNSRPIRGTRNKAPAYVFSRGSPSPSLHEPHRQREQVKAVMKILPKTRNPKLTSYRKNIIRGFLLSHRLEPGKYGKIGSRRWMEQLINKLDEDGDCRTSDTGLQAWLKVPLFSKMIKDLQRWEDEITSDTDASSASPSPGVSPKEPTPPESTLTRPDGVSEGIASMDTSAVPGSGADICVLIDDVSTDAGQLLPPMGNQLSKKSVPGIGTTKTQPSPTSTPEAISSGTRSLSNDTVNSMPCPPLLSNGTLENAEILIEQEQIPDNQKQIQVFRTFQVEKTTAEAIRGHLQTLEEQVSQLLQTHNHLMALGFRGFGMNILGIQLTGFAETVNHLINDT